MTYNDIDFTKEEFTKEENAVLIDAFPWLKPTNAFTGREIADYDYSYTMFDDIPIGWRAGFGKQWLEDVNEAYEEFDSKDGFRILQLKEKFGGFRQYFSYYNDRLSEVTRKYEELSEETCICCGEKAKWVTLGWISPFCDDCANSKLSASTVKITIEEYQNG